MDADIDDNMLISNVREQLALNSAPCLLFPGAVSRGVTETT